MKTFGAFTGIFDGISADTYHADFAEQPSLSSSIACVLCTRSPKHAWAAHPRLNPEFVREEKAKYDVGTVAHAFLLQGLDVAVVVDADSWRSNAAKEERDAARAAGLVPLLLKDWDTVRTMVAATRRQLDALDIDPPLFVYGKPEQTLVWEDSGVLCRARLDWLHNDHTAIDDYKTTTASAHASKWERTLVGIGADIQVAFYLRGLAAVTGKRAEFRFVVQETYPPYALSVVSLAPSALALANEKVQYAIDLWRGCLERDEWPGYSTRVCYVEAPGWATSEWLEKEAREEAAV